MQLKQLHYFSAIANCGSIAQAAKQLFISQPALTTSIKNFEKELGVSLFHRTPHGIALTSEGAYTLEIAQQIFDLEKALLEHFSSDPFADYSGLRIMTIPYIKDWFLPKNIVHFYKTFPKKTLEITCGSVETLTHHLSAGDIDLGFSQQIYCEGTPLYTTVPQVAYTSFCSAKYTVVLSPKCNLDHLSSISLNSLLNSDYYLLGLSGSNLTSAALFKILEYYQQPNKYLEVDSFNLLESFLATTPSFSLSPEIKRAVGENWKFTALSDSIYCELNYGIPPHAKDNPFLPYFTNQLEPLLNHYF